MNSKRQRRPNVRLGEVGDIPAAFACGYSHRNKTNFQDDLLNYNVTNQDHLYGFSLESISPADLQHNIENNNPNSSKSAFDLVNASDTDMAKAKLNFGTITRKSRVMKRRNRNTNVANTDSGNAWSAKISTEDKKDCNFSNFTRFSSDECSDNEDPKTSAESKEDCAKEGNLNELWQEDDLDEGISMSLGSGHGSGEMKLGGSGVNMVSRWLEEKGFGKYAGLFEMHKVDEEALLLLTMEDLKEIGVFAVGSRRKLYNAIQELGNDV